MPDRPAARPDEVRRHNLRLLLEHVNRDGELSRAELTQRMGLNRSTIGALVADLTDLGLLTEHVPSGNTGGDRAGRPSHVVGPRPDGPYALAADVEVDRVSCAAVAIGGRILARLEMRLDAQHNSPADVAALISAGANRLRATVPADAWPIGVGVSVPGTVRRTDHRIEFAPNLHWQDSPFRDLLAGRIGPGLPVDAGNDADLGALAEHLRGAGRGADDLIYLAGKIGVGGGIIVDGHPLPGHDGLAGEIGHVMLDTSGPICRCGGRGCIETFIGAGALLRRAGREDTAYRDGASAQEGVAELFAAARAGDAIALDAVRATGVLLGRSVASLVNLLNPQVVIMGGMLSEVLDLAERDVQAELAGRTMAPALRGVSLRTSGLGEDSSLLGAAELAFRRLFDDPVAAAAH